MTARKQKRKMKGNNIEGANLDSKRRWEEGYAGERQINAIDREGLWSKSERGGRGCSGASPISRGRKGRI